MKASGSHILPPVSSDTARGTKHICICVCTYKRPELLQRLLQALENLETAGRFTYSIVVADNDQKRSAEAVVSTFTATSAIPIKYCVEPQQNIALARNMAVGNASGDFLAFIDDDEFPTKEWLLTLLKTCDEFNVNGVLGPVKRHFDEPPPAWVLKSGFYDRPVRPTGSAVDWNEGRTGNVLFRTSLFSDPNASFNPEFRGGEDTDFFKRMIGKGYKFIWSAESVVFEVVPPLRWKKSFLLKRALLRGATTLKDPHFGVGDIAKSLIAIPAYLIALPFTLLWGQHKLMDFLVRLCDHLGKILAVLGIEPVKGHYVTE